MAGLVAYVSSGEEDEDTRNETAGSRDIDRAKNVKHGSLESSTPDTINGAHGSLTSSAVPLEQGKTDGDVLGPAGPPDDSALMGDTSSAPQSPYSANRAAIRNLTLPTVPNLDIPLSPSGSPPPGMEKKFDHFLELKKQGVHFNEKLAKSSALKNPSLLQKLMASAGVDEQDQYNTTLPVEIWNPKGFPTWAYKEELAKSAQEITKKRDEESSRLQRESIDFVSATNAEESIRNSTKGLKASAAERVMAGLDRERTRSTQGGPGTFKKGIESRVSRFDNDRKMPLVHIQEISSFIPKLQLFALEKALRLVRFLARDGRTYYGDAILPSGVSDIAKTSQARIIKGDIFGKHDVTDQVADVRLLLAPLAREDVKTVRCLGLNYEQHAKESKLPIPKYPVLFYKPNTSLAGPSDPIPVPAPALEAPGIDYECELVVIIGREALNVSAADALNHVLGYAVGNDVSHREWQLKRGGGQWGIGKGFDGWAPFGPGIATTKIIPDPQKLKIATELNGEVVQDSVTGDMIFSVREMISFLSQGTTLLPGDMIFTGT
ncbi:MAG: hypothetical protein HETSPECPRED_005604 [Heterodermia speciosa]|uniref:Fumarylacetoacetase-like C-terminal domain-containing protein n=1 Tax=Heterodermia speciosa TaxID=116794 RepID=A0A8H3IKT9_9LECA|nr:MAG: hypothetical protein HETSPECPRED_005604 [Heterodermia speciosa]